MSPERKGQAEEQRSFNEGHQRFQVSRGMILDAHMIGRGMGAAVELHENQEKVTKPPDKKQQHQDMDPKIRLSTPARWRRR